MSIGSFPRAFGVPARSRILTAAGWRNVSQVPPGTLLAHPSGRRSHLVSAIPRGVRRVVTIGLADGATFTVTEDQEFDVQLGVGQRKRSYSMSATFVHDALLRGCHVTLPRHQPYQFGSAVTPLNPYLVGVLLSDGYLRKHSTTLCNQQPELHALVAATLPTGAKLNPMKVGQAGTGSVEIVGTVHGFNPVTESLRNMGLAGCRAWEKYIPIAYLEAPLEARLALLQGVMDTDGSVDSYGRMAFTSSSELFAEQLLELVHGVGGRAGHSVDRNVHFTSPRQLTSKRGRDAYRLTNIRLPEGLIPFRRESSLSKMKSGRFARQWTINSVVPAGTEPVTQVAASANDGLWIGEGPAAFSSMQAAFSGLIPVAA
jgi:hypothetical protein